jgi:hypothetical protein
MSQRRSGRAVAAFIRMRAFRLRRSVGVSTTIEEPKPSWGSYASAANDFEGSAS